MQVLSNLSFGVAGERGKEETASGNRFRFSASFHNKQKYSRNNKKAVFFVYFVTGNMCNTSLQDRSAKVNFCERRRCPRQRDRVRHSGHRVRRVRRDGAGGQGGVGFKCECNFADTPAHPAHLHDPGGRGGGPRMRLER